jgi:hypothetical protein
VKRIDAIFAGLVIAFAFSLVHIAAQNAPPSVANTNSTVKALQAQNAADVAAITATQKMIDAGADNPSQLQAIIAAKRHEIIQNMRAIEGMSQGNARLASKQAVTNSSIPVLASASVNFEYDDANGNPIKTRDSYPVTHGISFQAYNAKNPHANWAVIDSGGGGITVHVRYGDSGWWQHRGKLLIAVP